MAKKRRKRRRSASVGRRSSHAYLRVNPRRRRRSSRRRNPQIVTRAISARGHRRRHHRRRNNPSAIRVGQILKDMIYGAGGAIATRAGASIAQSFIGSALGANPLVGPAVQAAVAVTLVRWGGKKFLGQQQGDIMMLGGLISAGLALADQYVPNLQGQLTGIVRAPVTVAPGVGATPALGDVYDVPGFAGHGLGDVYDVEPNQFNQLAGLQ